MPSKPKIQHTTWIIHAPPGAQYTIFPDGHLELKFVKGREQDTLNHLKNWLDSMQKHVIRQIEREMIANENKAVKDESSTIHKNSSHETNGKEHIQ